MHGRTINDYTVKPRPRVRETDGTRTQVIFDSHSNRCIEHRFHGEACLKVEGSAF